jgi:hypothetical protein
MWFNAPVGARLIATRDVNKVIELVGPAVTIGRAPECELQIADERVSTHHCRLSSHDDAWSIEDLASTNRTFVNGEPVGVQPRRLIHGDVVRLGAREARLFEAQFVAPERATTERRRSQVFDAAIDRKVAELQAELVASNAELVRMGAMYRGLQTQLTANAMAQVAAQRASAAMTSELEALREQLQEARADHAGCDAAAARLARRTAELEAQLDVQDRRARRELDDANRRCKELEGKLSLTASDLAVARRALAIEAENVQTLKAAHDDVLTRLHSLE